ncbi:MAG TPA: glycoside hydrolase family 20 zincin-like fold domain-containing protein [Terriglobia bacterium]|nr:glycoside hydrolase family 20 zincin-like fold domain-containing protein [Terriglobia bacterium]
MKGLVDQMKESLSLRRAVFAAALAVLCVLATEGLAAAAESSLFDRGYNVIPVPQKVESKGSDFEIGSGWRLELGRGVKADDVAVESLKHGLETRHGIALETRGRGKSITLEIHSGSVKIGQAADKDRQALEEQAYSLEMSGSGIKITANAPTGLFYGVETLLQLVKHAEGKLWLPEASLTDWPDLEQRNIYWDDNHHLERIEVLKQALRQAAFYKINGFVIKLNDHFEYQSAPALVNPYALTPAQLQELTDYGLKYHVQLIPYLDGPAHIAFILKHPEYAKLREFPDSNYELCTTNPDSYKLLEGMYQDLLDANKGVNYFYLSTDEPYFVGMADNAQCQSKNRADELGSRGKLLAEFVTKTADYLHQRGRKVVFWGEFPLVTGDIPSLPSYLINGEVYGKTFDEAFKAHGIKQMIFISTVGWKELLFPSYYVRPVTEMLPNSAGGAYQPVPPGPGIVPEMFNMISHTPDREYADLMGAVVAGWGDAGLSTETMWLGYATGTAPAWHPGGENPKELMSSFYQLFYGTGTENMGWLYQMMSEQGQFYKESWDVAPSNARIGIWGDYAPVIYKPRRPADDQTLPLPPVPSGELLTRDHGWAKLNARRLDLASSYFAQSDTLVDLLNRNLQSVQFNHYNLELYVSVARLYRQNLQMLMDLQEINSSLNSGEKAAGEAQASEAVEAVDRALDLAQQIRQQRNAAYASAVRVWDIAWYPRVEEANGRKYLNQIDDVKDHLPGRTADLSYLIYRELLLPLGKWYDQVEAARNQYAKRYDLPSRDDKLNWKDYSTPAQ